MLQTRALIVSALTLFVSVTAFAQEKNAALDNFHTFFAPFLDGEWNYQTRMTDKAGAVVLEATDVRRYRLGIRDRYVIESAYSPDAERAHVGMTLIGVDMETGRINFSAFWPWKSTALGSLEAELELKADGRSRLQGTGRPAGQTFPVIDIECEFLSEREFRCITHTTDAEGERFKSNEERFTLRDRV